MYCPSATAFCIPQWSQASQYLQSLSLSYIYFHWVYKGSTGWLLLLRKNWEVIILFQVLWRALGISSSVLPWYQDVPSFILSWLYTQPEDNYCVTDSFASRLHLITSCFFSGQMVWPCLKQWLRRLSFCYQLFQSPTWPSPSHSIWLCLSFRICKGIWTFAEHFGLLLILHRVSEMWWTL